MRVTPSETQPDARALLDYDAVAEKLGHLSGSPRVWIGTAGRSVRGRDIPYLVVGQPTVVEELERYRRIARSVAFPSGTSATGAVGYVPRDGEDPLLPVLLVGGSFGNEAAHTEALLELAEMLAESTSPRVMRILKETIAIIIPSMNPDGREAAIREWRTHPLSPALVGSVNANGVMLNRDFFSATQPETRAVLGVYREWHPVAAYDPHEDMYYLGVAREELCWTPPFARPVYSELAAEVVRMIGWIGNAIADEWRQRGYVMLHDRDGNHGFMNLLRLGGRFHLCMALHGVPAVITESARTPGTQSWRERTEQKVAAGLAVLETVAESPDQFTHAVRASRTPPQDDRTIVLTPPLGLSESLRQLVEILRLHDVRVYRAAKAQDEYLVPLQQHEHRIVRSLLGEGGSNLLSLPAAMGVRAVWRDDVHVGRDDIRPVHYVGASCHRGTVLRSNDGMAVRAGTHLVAIPNSVHGVRYVNELWDTGATVSWAVEPFTANETEFPRGSFVVSVSHPAALETSNPHRTWSVIGDSLPVTVALRQPTVGLYVGGGVDDRYWSTTADTAWALRRMGFRVLPIRDEDVGPEVIERITALIVPAGDADEIVNGSKHEHPWQRSPWQYASRGRGIGRRGLDAIRNFVERGGTYVGIGCGGGALATHNGLGLLEADIVAETLGEARVLLRVDAPNHPVMFGFDGGFDHARQWRDRVVTAYYYSERFAGLRGGPIFAVRGDTRSLATYWGLEDETARVHLVSDEYFSAERGYAAIIHRRVSKGSATAIAIAVDFRGIWHSTMPLLSNAIMAGIAVASPIE